MLDPTWRRAFSSRILERGGRYCRHGLVGPLEERNGRIHTTVYGGETYSVELVLKGTAVAGMKCSCPYAAAGNACKHMAAVLLALERGRLPVGERPPEEETEPAAPESYFSQLRENLTVRAGALAGQGRVTQALRLAGAVYLAAEELPESRREALRRECAAFWRGLLTEAGERQRRELLRLLEQILREGRA